MRPHKETDLRPMLAALLAGAGFFALMARRPRSPRQDPRQGRVKHSGEAERARETPGQGQPGRAISPQSADHHGDSAAEERKRAEADRAAREDRRWRAELAYWIVSGVTGAAAAGAAAFAGWYAKGAYEASLHAAQEARRQADAAFDQTRIAQNTLIAGERPWVSAKVSIGGPVQYNLNGMRFTFHFSFQNSGHSPALMIWPHFAIVPHAPHADYRAEQKKVCDPLRVQSDEAPRSGFTLFPGQNFDMNSSNFIYWQDLYDIILKGGRSVMPALVGCISYAFASDGSRHQTGFVFDIYKRGPGLPGIPEGFYPVDIRAFDGPDIPAQELRLVPTSLFGGFYAD